MRIDALNAASKIYEANTTSAVKSDNSSHKKLNDQFEISQTAKDYQVAKAAVKEADDVRADKVAKIKAMMEKGTYNISSEAIANKILNSVTTLTF